MFFVFFKSSTMTKTFVFILYSFCVVYGTLQGSTTTATCTNSANNSRTLILSVNRRLNQSDGEWYTNLAAQKVSSEPSDLTLEAIHRHEEFHGKHMVKIELLVKEGVRQSSGISRDDPLLFHPRHGSNVVILNNGRSVHKLDSSVPENSVVFTKRPLMNNEMFEVRMDKRSNKMKHALGIGVMSHPPEDVEMVSSMHRLGNGTWMYHNNGIYGNSRALIQNYGVDINNLQARDRVGVMRKEDGSLHFFVNGEDQGHALSDIPQPIYGVFELWHDGLHGTIVY